MPEEALRLYPLPEERHTKGTQVYRDLKLPGSNLSSKRRPYVFINMASSLDGNTSIEGKASGIGTAVDRCVMRTLRSKADAVMIGAGTLRAERLSLGLDAGDADPSPLAVILSSTGDVPIERNLIRYSHQRVLILLDDSVSDAASSRLSDHAEVVRVSAGASGGGGLDSALEVLKNEYAVRRLLVEGGPTLNHALISAGLADELFITLAPTLLGKGDADTPSILGGPLNKPQNLQLISAYLADNELFLRYTLSL